MYAFAHKHSSYWHNEAQFISERMRESDVWCNASEAEFDNAMEGMEKLVMNRLYELCVPGTHELWTMLSPL